MVQPRKQSILEASCIEGPLFVVGNSSYQLFLHSLLVGHENWIYSVEWQPPTLLLVVEAHLWARLWWLWYGGHRKIWPLDKFSDNWWIKSLITSISWWPLGIWCQMYYSTWLWCFFFSYVEPGGNSMLADGYSRLFHMWGFFLNFFMWGLVALYSDCQPQIVSGNFEPYLVPFWWISLHN